jgi:hypothetical protein
VRAAARPLAALAVVAACWLGVAPAAPGQVASVRSRLVARGVPASLAASVQRVAADASRRGLPSGPLVDKTLEGWAKRVPADRILAAVRGLAVRLGEAQDALARANSPYARQTAVLSGAADALARGLSRDDVTRIAAEARRSDLAAAGLSVAAALAAQGISRGDATELVVNAVRAQSGANARVLDLPGAARAMLASGVPAGEVGRRMLAARVPGLLTPRASPARPGPPPLVPPALPAGARRP